MSANEISPTANPRLNKIRTVSRFVKWAIFALGSSSVLFFLLFPGSLSPRANIWHALFMMSFLIVLCIWYWKLTRLFHFYEQGLIFAAETIRCIKLLGILWLIGWVFLTAAHFTPRQITARTVSPPSNASAPTQAVSPESVQTPPGETVPLTHTTPVVRNKFYVRFGFLTFDFGWGIDFGMPLRAAIIILIAWIMDEGRKIQDEQELTV
jgi:hypothetical protein